MIALLKIHCPHCGAAGQILMPPPGAVIIGPCPECNRLVAIFAGAALPLDDNIMNNGEMKDKYEHVMHVLSEYLERQVRECFSKPVAPNDTGHAEHGDNPHRDDSQRTRPITDSEMERFVQDELSELDNPDFFRRFL